MKIFTQILIILLALSSATFLCAQNNDDVVYSKYPLKIAFGNHTVGFPFENSFSAFNPNFSIGTEKALNKNLKHRLFLSSNLGLIRNKVIGNTITPQMGLLKRSKILVDSLH